MMSSIPRLRSFLTIAVLATLSLTASAATPVGRYQCRRYPPQGGASPYGDPVAYIWLRANGAYDFLDLTITRGKISGQYAYDKKKHEVDWTTGDLDKYVGHYTHNVSGTDAVRLNTRKDPAGNVDGTLWCLRVPND